jgi:aminopeptidase N
MRKHSLTVLFLAVTMHALPQSSDDTVWKTIYRESFPKVNDLIDTKLKVRFDLKDSRMLGEEWTIIKPHFYPTDSLDLDAKQMTIKEVALVVGAISRPIPYTYDGWHLKIKLNKTYTAKEKYKIYIKYIANPNKAKVPDNQKGLYFINPKNEDKSISTEIWTDGETNHNSTWFPTIDQPNQRTTEEIIMTVPQNFVTLSNGKLVSDHLNSDGSRTDDWKMDLPHAPYLFFMGAGDFSIIKDQYKGKEVNYYVEKEFASTARRIFGLTPSMIAFFEQVTGVPFPWVKYSQIVLRNFTSTAMENTTATAHAEPAQQDARELVDGNRWESNIAHELFHQWFGDYVTCESWSNLTLNESFANYSQYLWKKHAYSDDEARAELYNGMADYLRNRADEAKPLVRFYYADQEDLFDGVSYQKGGLILHMLKNYLGDSAFFKGLHLYLVTNKFKAAEVHQLRLAMEEVSGQDLNWFFNQWYFGSGHPKVTIDYSYDDASKKMNVTIIQTQGAQHLFRIPLSVDVYANGVKKSYNICISREKEIFTFDCPSTPDLVNVDANKITLWDKKDNKTIQNFIFQYAHAGNYCDRREAIAECAKHQFEPDALDLVIKALKDPYYGLRLFTLEQLNMKSDTVKQAVKNVLVALAGTDSKPAVQAKAIELLGTYRNKEFQNIFVAHLNDSSYSVAGASLVALAALDSSAALAEAEQEMTIITKRKLAVAVIGVLMDFGSEDQFEFIATKYESQPFIFPDKITSTIHFIRYLAKVHQTEKLKRAIDVIILFRDILPAILKPRINPELTRLASQKDSQGLNEQADYIRRYL